MTRFEIDFRGHADDVDDILTAAHGQMYWLARACGTRACPPFDASLNDAIKFFGMPPNAALDLWMMLAPIDRLSRRWTGKALEWPGGAVPAASPAVADPEQDEPVGPDEGAVTASDTPGDAVPGQSRLGGS